MPRAVPADVSPLGIAELAVYCTGDWDEARVAEHAGGHPGRQVTDGNTGPLLDRLALAAYRRRLAELDEDLAEADDRADLVRSERLTVEREALLAKVAEAPGNVPGSPSARRSPLPWSGLPEPTPDLPGCCAPR